MIAVDTNVVVRYIARDDPVQSPKAKAFVDDNEVFVFTTVALEAGWVLASRHRFSRDDVTRALSGFLGLPTVTPENPVATRKALGWIENGLGFADALHLAQAEAKDAFVTFDRDLAKTGDRLASVPVRLL